MLLKRKTLQGLAAVFIFSVSLLAGCATVPSYNFGYHIENENTLQLKHLEPQQVFPVELEGRQSQYFL